MQFLTTFPFLIILFIVNHVSGASTANSKAPISLSESSITDSEKLEAGLASENPIPHLCQLIKIDESASVADNNLIVETIEEKNIRILVFLVLHSIFLNSHKLFLRSLFECEKEDVEFKKYLDEKIGFRAKKRFEMSMSEYLLSQGIFGILRRPNELFKKISDDVYSFSWHYNKEKGDSIERFISKFPSLEMLTEFNSLQVYEALLGEIVHGDTTRLSVNLAIDTDIQKLTKFYMVNSKVKWFVQTSEVHMGDLGCGKDELKLVEELGIYLVDPRNEVDKFLFFKPNSPELTTLRKIVNPLGTSDTTIDRTIEMFLSRGIFHVLLYDPNNILINLTRLLELYFKSVTLKKMLHPKCDITRFFSSLGLLRGIASCEQLSYLLFKYLTRTSQDLRKKLAKFIVGMKEDEKLMLENWQFAVFDFKSEFSLCSNKNQALVAVDEMIVSNIWPSLIGRSLADAYLQSIPFKDVFFKKIAQSLPIGNNPQYTCGLYAPGDLGKVPKVQFQPSVFELNPKLYECTDVFQAIYYYRNYSKEEAASSIDIMKSLFPKDQQSDRIAKFLRNLPITSNFEDFKLFYPMLQNAYFDGTIRESDAVYLFSRRKHIPQLIICLKGLTEGKFYSNVLDKITSSDEILVVLSALKFC
jgi:hypothetical protein